MSNNTKWSEEQYAKYLASHAKRIRAEHPQPVKRRTLERPCFRENQGVSRVGIKFRIYAIRAADWDGYDFKGLIDMLTKASILETDQWNRLECTGIKSEEVYTKEEERTEIEIDYP